jgi:hypothetical protein
MTEYFSKSARELILKKLNRPKKMPKPKVYYNSDEEIMDAARKVNQEGVQGTKGKEVFHLLSLHNQIQKLVRNMFTCGIAMACL